VSRIDSIRQSITAVEQGLLPFFGQLQKDSDAAGELALRIQQLHVLGLSCTVVDQSVTRWAQQYGVIQCASQLPVAVTTRFNICSMTTMVTSMLTLV